jgi:predicted DNA-binding protein (UPF0251 family)
MTNPVRIRGVDYPSQKAAADALGVSRATVNQALDRGRIEFVGLGKGYGPTRRRKPCVVDGTRYPSQAAAAAALGVTRSAIHYRLKRARQT